MAFNLRKSDRKNLDNVTQNQKCRTDFSVLTTWEDARRSAGAAFCELKTGSPAFSGYGIASATELSLGSSGSPKHFYPLSSHQLYQLAQVIVILAWSAMLFCLMQLCTSSNNLTVLRQSSDIFAPGDVDINILTAIMIIL
jgi:hypothetical protein